MEINEFARKLSIVCGYHTRYAFTKNWEDMPSWEKDSWIEKATIIINYIRKDECHES